MLSLQGQEVKIAVAATSDVHGCLFPYDFEEGRPGKSSLTGVYHLTDSMRRAGIPLVLLENGDLGLASAALYTHRELYFAGLAQILLGLAALALPQYGLLLWAAGFGVVHILYGLYMYFVHEREPLNPGK